MWRPVYKVHLFKGEGADVEIMMDHRCCEHCTLAEKFGAKILGYPKD